MADWTFRYRSETWVLPRQRLTSRYLPDFWRVLSSKDPSFRYGLPTTRPRRPQPPWTSVGLSLALAACAGPEDPEFSLDGDWSVEVWREQALPEQSSWDDPDIGAEVDSWVGDMRMEGLSMSVLLTYTRTVSDDWGSTDTVTEQSLAGDVEFSAPGHFHAALQDADSGDVAHLSCDVRTARMLTCTELLYTQVRVPDIFRRAAAR